MNELLRYLRVALLAAACLLGFALGAVGVFIVVVTSGLKGDGGYGDPLVQLISATGVAVGSAVTVIGAIVAAVTMHIIVPARAKERAEDVSTEPR